MMAAAKYTIAVPKQDEHGNPLRVGQAAQHYLHYLAPHRSQNIHMIKADPHDMLHAYAEDHAEHDSHFKQLAAYVGDVANVQSVAAVKEGKQGIQTWDVRNPKYQPGQPAAASSQQPVRPQSLT